MQGDAKAPDHRPLPEAVDRIGRWRAIGIGDRAAVCAARKRPHAEGDAFAPTFMSRLVVLNTASGEEV